MIASVEVGKSNSQQNEEVQDVTIVVGINIAVSIAILLIFTLLIIIVRYVLV